MKRILSFIICACIIFSVGVSPCQAASPSFDPGYYRLSGESEQTEHDGKEDDRQRATTSGADSFTGKVYTHNNRFDSSYEIKRGVDVSEYQGAISTDNWKKAKAAGVSFAIVRVAYRGYGKAGNLVYDRYYAQNIKNAAAAGIPVGVYIYSQAITVDEGKEEADFVLSIIKQFDIKLPVVIDYEYASLPTGLGGRLWNAKLTKAQATNIVNAFCKRVIGAGYTPMVYANSDMLTNHMNAADIPYYIWLANYTTKTSYKGDYRFWQYSSTGSVPGISGNVDVNFWYYSEQEVKIFVTDCRRTTGSLEIRWKSQLPAGCKFKKYRVYRYKLQPDDYVEVADVADIDGVYKESGLASGAQYKFKIEAVFYDSAGAEHTGEPLFYNAVTSPKAPVLKFTSSNSSSVNFSWNKVNGATGYEIYRKSAGSADYKRIKVVGASVLKYTDSGLGAASSYSYRVRAYRAFSGANYYSAYGTALTAYTGPKSVSSLTAASPKSTQIKLSWKKVGGASGYQIYRYNTKTARYEKIKELSASSLSYLNTVIAKKKYKYAVRPFRTVSGKKVYGTFVNIGAVGRCTGTVTASSLNVRSGAGSTYKVKFKLKRGSKVTVTGAASGWYSISCVRSGRTYTGYVSQSYIKI